MATVEKKEKINKKKNQQKNFFTSVAKNFFFYEGGALMKECFRLNVTGYTYSDGCDKYVQLDVGEDLHTDDSVEVIKCYLSRKLKVSPARVSLFFTNGNIVGPNQKQAKLHTVLEILRGVTLPAGDTVIVDDPPKMTDVAQFERVRMLCEVENFERSLFVFVRPKGLHDDNLPARQYWPRYTVEAGRKLVPKEMLRSEWLTSQSIKHQAIISWTVLGDISDCVKLQTCIIEYAVESEKRYSFTPEYVFGDLQLCSTVPFAMCRTLIDGESCKIRVHEESRDICKRNWAYERLDCKKELVVKGILFRVVLSEQHTVMIEWLPRGGTIRCTLTHDHIDDIAVPGLQQRMIAMTDAALSVLLKAQISPSFPTSDVLQSGKVIRMSVEYLAYATVPDITRLIDSEIFDALFTKKKTASQTSRKAQSRVSMLYHPVPLRTKTRLPHNRLVKCLISRSVANGVQAIMTLRASNGSSIQSHTVVHATAAIRYMISKTLPREFIRPYSTLGMRQVDPELYNSVKNCGLSRKMWSTFEKTTQTTRHRRPRPLNPKSERDMERYDSAVESGPMLLLRGVYYASIDDELANSKTIKALRAKRKIKKLKSKRLPADVMFFGLTVLTTIDESKYRVEGYETEEQFRLFPKCIRYRHGMKLSPTVLSVMAPLLRRGVISYVGHDSENVLKQLREFSGKLTVGPKYVTTKTDKILPPGAYGELPAGTLREFAAKSEYHWLRRGVIQDKDLRFSSLHALFDACQIEVYVDMESATEKESCVRSEWPSFFTSSYGDDVDSIRMSDDDKFRDELIIDAFSSSKCVNVLIFKHSSINTQNTTVRFSNECWVREWPIVMLFCNGNSYEPICLGGESNIDPDDDIKTLIEPLYQAFYPQQHQNDARMMLLEEYLGEPTCVHVDQFDLQYAVGFDGDIQVPMVVLKRRQTFDLQKLEHQGQLFYSIQHIQSLLTIANSDEKLQVFLPKQLLVDSLSMVHAVVLLDSRLICCLEKPLKVEEIMQLHTFEVIKNSNIDVPFIGMPADEKPDTTVIVAFDDDRMMSIREAFRIGLRNMYSWVVSAPDVRLKVEIGNNQTYRQRRHNISNLANLVVQQLSHGGMIDSSVSPQVMCAMLVAFCDHHPDIKDWWYDSLNDVATTQLLSDAVRNGGTDSASASASASASGDTTTIDGWTPKQYLRWVTRA